MRALYERYCGLDVHKKTVVACVITPEGRETRTFGTMTADLLQLADRLLAKGVTAVAMESTGVFWKPPYNLLEGTGLELLVVNAAHIRAVPGRPPPAAASPHARQRPAPAHEDPPRAAYQVGSSLAGNGPREKELVHLQLQHYDARAGVITIPARGTKGQTGYRRSRQLELDEVVGSELDRYLADP